MFDVRKCVYLVVMFCFLIVPLSFQVWAEEELKKIATSERQKAENQQEQAPAQNQPQISFDNTKYNAGEVWEGEEVSHTFIVKNTGTAQLNINKVRAG